jgi:hypothetical protein
VSIAEDLAKGIRDVTKGWKTEKRHADRHDRVSYHSLARMRLGRVKPITREVAFDVMQQAYNHASANGLYYANARQIMYAARPLMLKKEPSLSLDGKFSVYFTQVILKDDLEEHSPGWKVVNEQSTNEGFPVDKRPQKSPGINSGTHERVQKT